MYTEIEREQGDKQMAAYLNGRYESERPHSPYEADEVECRDCFENLSDPDEEACSACGEPLCIDCAHVVNDEPLCAKCFAALLAQALKRLQRDPLVGDVFGRVA
jgi:formylmethanofuran dehydrogenase subunit E